MPTNQRALVVCILDRKFLLSLLKWRMMATYRMKIFRIVLVRVLTYEPHFIHNATTFIVFSYILLNLSLL